MGNGSDATSDWDDWDDDDDTISSKNNQGLGGPGNFGLIIPRDTSDVTSKGDGAAVRTGTVKRFNRYVKIQIWLPWNCSRIREVHLERASPPSTASSQECGEPGLKDGISKRSWMSFTPCEGKGSDPLRRRRRMETRRVFRCIRDRVSWIRKRAHPSLHHCWRLPRSLMKPFKQLSVPLLRTGRVREWDGVDQTASVRRRNP